MIIIVRLIIFSKQFIKACCCDVSCQSSGITTEHSVLLLVHCHYADITTTPVLLTDHSYPNFQISDATTTQKSRTKKTASQALRFNSGLRVPDLKALLTSIIAITYQRR